MKRHIIDAGCNFLRIPGRGYFAVKCGTCTFNTRIEAVAAYLFLDVILGPDFFLSTHMYYRNIVFIVKSVHLVGSIEDH